MNIKVLTLALLSLGAAFATSSCEDEEVDEKYIVDGKDIYMGQEPLRAEFYYNKANYSVVLLKSEKLIQGINSVEAFIFKPQVSGKRSEIISSPDWYVINVTPRNTTTGTVAETSKLIWDKKKVRHVGQINLPEAGNWQMHISIDNVDLDNPEESKTTIAGTDIDENGLSKILWTKNL